jgi:TonB-dependent receptor
LKPPVASPPAGALLRGLSGVAVAALTLAASPSAWAAPPGAAQVQVFDIPAQEASSALLKLCLQADCELAFSRRPGHAVRTRHVQGRMTWRTALASLLVGTELRYRFVGARGVRIWVEAPATAHPSSPPPPPLAEGEVEAVEVIGRPSAQIDKALRRKREADVISDGLTAQRIGDLPAANLAEALQRVPGVAIEREVGEGQFVSVRGLGPLFQSVTLNGAPVAFNENIRNSTQSGRQFRFRALSVDLLAGANLTKTATPDLIDGGIGSNIDIETAGGLDGAPFLSIRVGGEGEARTGRFSPDLSIAGRQVSIDGNRGLIAGLSQEARSVRYDRFQIMRYSEHIIDGQTLVLPNDVRTTVETEERLRRSTFIGADWRVSPTLTLDADLLASTFDNAIREDRLVYGLGERLAQPDAIVRVENGVVTAAQIDDGRIDNNTEFSDQSHLNLVASLGAVMRLGDWRLAPRLSASQAYSVLATPLERFSARSPEGVDYVFDLGRAAATRKAARLETSFNVLDPSRLGQAQLGVRAVESRDEDVTVLFDARRPLDRAWSGVRLSTFRLGGQFSDRSRDYQRRDRAAALRAADMDVADFYTGATAEDIFSRLISTRSTPWSTPDFAAVRAAFVIPGERGDVVFRPGDLTPTGSDLQNSYRVGEQVAAAYARLDFDGAVRAVPFSGNLGLRLVRAKTRVEGARMGLVDGAAGVTAVSHGGDQQVLLPSLNLAFDATDRAIVRLAASRTTTRPSLADLRASTVPASILVSAIYRRGQAAIDDPEPGVIFSGVGGNPELAHYVSTNLDLSYEFTGAGAGFSAAAFHKRIDHFIQSVEAPELLTFETWSGAPVQAEVLMSRPRNVGQARVQGLEVSVHRRLASGWGVWSNATWTHSRLADGGRLTGVSDLAWSVSPYVERGPFAVNLSWSWRSAFRSEADLQGGGISAFVVAPAGYLDAQARYRLNRRAQLTVSATNLTDTRDLAYEGSRERLLQLGSVGRRLSLAVEVAW